MKIAELKYQKEKDRIRIKEFSNIATPKELIENLGRKNYSKYIHSTPYFLNIGKCVQVCFKNSDLSKKRIIQKKEAGDKKAYKVGQHFSLILQKEDIVSSEGFEEIIRLMKKAGNKLTSIRKQIEAEKLKVVRI